MDTDDASPSPTDGPLATRAVAERALAGLVNAVTAAASGDLALAVGTLRGWRTTGLSLYPLADEAWALLRHAGAPLPEGDATDHLLGLLRGTPSGVAPTRAALVTAKRALPPRLDLVTQPVEGAWSAIHRAYQQVGDAVRVGDPEAAEDALRGATGILDGLRDVAVVSPVVVPEAAVPAVPPEPDASDDPLPSDDHEGDDEDELVGPPPEHLEPPTASRGDRGRPVPWTSVATMVFVAAAMAAAVIWLFVIASG